MKNFFYEPIKISGKDKNILFWGCLHIGHACEKWEVPLYKRRGFESLQEHDETLIKNWNSKANHETVGFLLGDNVFGRGAAERLESLFERLNFNILYVMPGNHYSGWRQHFLKCENNVKFLWEGQKIIYFVPNYLEAFINGQSVVMSHYPILSFNGQGRSSWMIFCHVHNSLGNSEVGKLYLKNYKVLEVSPEIHKFPLDFGEIRAELQNKILHTPDHHGPHTQNPF